MKRFLLIVLSLLLLCGCGGKPGDPVTPDKPVEPATTPEPEPEPEPVSGTPLTDAYVEALDDYVDFEIAFLGLIMEGQSLADVLERAMNVDFGFLSELPESQLVYGDVGQYGNNVYLIIPNQNTDLCIGSYERKTDSMGEIYYKAEYSAPVIFIENADSTDPLSLISSMRYSVDGSKVISENSMWSGFSYADNRLRTAFHMGIVDATNYELFDSSEVPFYGQYLFDVLCYEIPEISKQMQDGTYRASCMDEFYHDGHMYVMYEVSDTSTSQTVDYYAVRYDPETMGPSILTTQNMIDWYPYN